MKHCTKCGGEIEDTAKFCTWCGAAVAPAPAPAPNPAAAAAAVAATAPAAVAAAAVDAMPKPATYQVPPTGAYQAPASIRYEQPIYGKPYSAPQTGTYQLMYEATKKVTTVGSQIIALSTSSRPAAAVSPIFDARRVMVGEAGKPGLIEHAAAMFRGGLFPPNPSSVLCSQKYGARWSSCLFR